MNKRILSLLLCLLLMVTAAMPVSAAKKKTVEKEPVIIQTTADLLAFAENCRLDTYSEALTVTLEEDLDLTGVEFMPIPSFSGTFEGNGHSISGLIVTVEGSAQGLFRYLTETAIVQNLYVDGTVTPDGSRGTVGGIVGRNAGSVIGCTFSGTVSGGDMIGGIAGVNAVTGVIENCTVDASVSGMHFVGGIGGNNEGVIRGCINRGTVNTTSRENSVKLENITVESLTNTDSAAASTDIGGIAGKSSGVIRSCENYGNIGYRQMGYNVGGIAGTQSGYLAECTNHGNVSGRKEVGGIVGQMEPMSKIEYSRDALQILEGQLNTLSGLTSRATGNVQNNAGAMNAKLGELRDQAQTAGEAVGVLLPGGTSDPDSIVAAQNALAESVTGMSGTMNEITAAANNTTTSLTRDLQAISGQISSMSRTLNAVTNSLGASFEDISDSDTKDDLGGKVQSCVNYGTVLGDMNVGGISGAMALENDMDPEDDWAVSGETSMNVATELRAVLLSSENYGAVTVNKQHGGGVVGWMYLGLVKGSLNAGDVNGSSADYVGGVAGRSSGYIRENSAKCTVYGSSYVGGIAGLGEIVTDCRSVVVTVGGKERIGGILGYAETNDEEKNPIDGNYYMIIDTDPGAIDGISYGGKAEPKDHEEFLALAQIPEPLQNVTVRFVFENGKAKELTVPVGSCVPAEDIPEVPEKQGYAGQWEGLADADLNEVLFDMEFHVLYIGENAVLESDVCRENGRPVVLAQGAFTTEATVSLKESDEEPVPGFNQTVHESWTVTLSEPVHATGLRYRIPDRVDAERIEIRVRSTDGVWRTVDHRIDGSYAAFDFDADDTAFAVLVTPKMNVVLVVLLIGAGLLLWQYHDRLKPKKKT